jgi:uncharacterized GH25 family protein
LFINGTVRDAAGAPVPGATVILEEKGQSGTSSAAGRGAIVEGKTDAQGTFSFLALRGGIYLVRAKMKGFREAVTPPMGLSLGDKKQLKLVLKKAARTGPV